MLGFRLIILAALLVPLEANAEDVGDVRAGFTFAKQNCAECHAVKEGEGKSPNPKAPPFTIVAGMPSMTGRALAVWLQSSHPTMPNFILPEKDRDNVIAYILSLKPVPEQ